MIKAKIRKIEIIPIQIPLNETFHISKGPLDQASVTVVKIYSDQGIYGIGEATPFRTKFTETQSGSVAAAKKIAEQLIGKNPVQINSLIRDMNKLFVGPASIKSAFDIALHDLKAKLYDVPLYQLLGGNPDKFMLTDRTVSLQSADKMVEQAMRFQAEGFTIQKIKLGERPASKDIKRMQQIRIALGSDAVLKIDANQGWNLIEAKKALDGLKDLNIEYCEAPINSENLHHLHLLNAYSSIPIMGDESVYDPLDAIHVITSNSVDLINIKLGKAGGIRNAALIAGIAEAKDIYCQVGCFAETRLGITALAHFATAWDNIVHFDMDSPTMQRDDPIQGGISYNDDWTIAMNHAPGLGADYDLSYLNQFERIQID